MTRPERTYILIALALLGLYFLPYILLGENAYLTIHDNLDSDFLYLHLLKISRLAFATDPMVLVPNMMNGVPRSALRSGLNLEVLLFYVLPSYAAYVVNLILIHLTGFVGMLILLKRYGLPDDRWALTRVGIALCFALIPGYVVHGISVSGQPLLLYAFLNVFYRRQNWSDWLIIGFFPFYSFLVWSGLFILIGLGVLGLVLMARSRQLRWDYWAGLIIVALGYGVSEWQMIYSFLAKLYISHRTEYDYARLLPQTFVHSWGKSVQLLTETQYHSGSYQTRWIRGTLVVAAAVAFWKRDYPALQQLLLFSTLIVLICLFTGFYRFPAIWLGQGNVLQAFQFDRFYFLLPFLWLWILVVAIRVFGPTSWIPFIFVVGQFYVIIKANHEFQINAQKLAGSVDNSYYMSYRAFYAPKQFAQIRDYIGQPQASYRVACLGMHPAVALYNGFYTVDSYQNNYLLSYKHAFRQVIAAELDKAPKIRRYYDAYGCRCYTYTAELGMSAENFLCGKKSKKQLWKLALNTAALHALGGRYVLSAIPIQNAFSNHLQLQRVFNDSASYWRIYLYKIQL